MRNAHLSRFTFNKYWFAIGLLSVLLLAGAIRDFTHSMFLHRKDRISVLFYGEDTRFYSFGLEDTVNYNIAFFPDLKIPIPGGYGLYRIGAIGKLVKLERNPVILKKAFSTATTSFVDYYFYPETDTIYYGHEPKEPKTPGFGSIFFEASNTGFFDRLYLFLLFSRVSPEQYRNISDVPYKKDGDDYIFREDQFKKDNEGFFYNKNFRQEKKNVQILYTSQYANGDFVASMLEGSGIRVSDISEYEGKGTPRCAIIEPQGKYSETARELSAFYNCPLQHGKTDIYDILFVLGEREKEWAVR